MRDLGNLLLAFVIFWAYVSFSQFLIIWAGNLPREISWYLHRRAGGWPAVAGVLAIAAVWPALLPCCSRAPPSITRGALAAHRRAHLRRGHPECLLAGDPQL